MTAAPAAAVRSGPPVPAPGPEAAGRSPSHRARLLAGLAVALALGVGGGSLVLRGARAQVTEDVRTREAIVSALALDELVQRAGVRGDRVRAALAAWQARQPAGTVARVVLLDGIRLEISTAPADAGDRAAPRRLARDEKPLFDRAQRLRGAVNANREGGATKPELEADPRPDGGRSLAVPLEIGGQVAGMVELEVPPLPAPAPSPWAGALLAFALPLAAFWLAARAIGERRWPLAGAAAAALALGMAGFALSAAGGLGGAHRAGHEAVAAHALAQARALEQLLPGGGGASLDSAAPGEPLRSGRTEGPGGAPLDSAAPAEPPRSGRTEGLGGAPLSPGSWDADAFRRPRGFLAPDGSLDRAAVEADVAAARGDARGALAGAALVALAALAAIGLGGLSRAGRALVVHRQAYAYVAPAVLGTLVLVFFPFFYGIALSFTSQNIYNTAEPLASLWVGLRNYASILGDFGVARRAADGAWAFNYLNFYWTFFFTVVWTVTNVTFGVSFGLLLALILNVKGLALRPIYRVVLILPWAMPNYITALVWKGMFHRQFGVVNQGLALFGFEPLSWFDTPVSSFLTALATNGWLSFPFMMVVSLGALQSIPADIYEAARVDGATRWQQFRAITLPSLKPALVPAVILSVVWTFNMFNIIYLVTGGEPSGATEILVTQAYKFAFQRYQYGYAAAYATIIFGILLVYGTLQNRVTRATEAI